MPDITAAAINQQIGRNAFDDNGGAGPLALNFDVLVESNLSLSSGAAKFIYLLLQAARATALSTGNATDTYQFINRAIVPANGTPQALYRANITVLAEMPTKVFALGTAPSKEPAIVVVDESPSFLSGDIISIRDVSGAAWPLATVDGVAYSTAVPDGTLEQLFSSVGMALSPTEPNTVQVKDRALYEPPGGASRERIDSQPIFNTTENEMYAAAWGYVAGEPLLSSALMCVDEKGHAMRMSLEGRLSVVLPLVGGEERLIRLDTLASPDVLNTLVLDINGDNVEIWLSGTLEKSVTESNIATLTNRKVCISIAGIRMFLVGRWRESEKLTPKQTHEEIVARLGTIAPFGS